MTATTGTFLAALKIDSSLNMMSDAVTVPPGLLMRMISAFTSESSAAFLSSSRKRTSRPTRGARRPDDEGLGLTFFGEKPRDVRQHDLRPPVAFDGALLERLDPR